MLKIVSFLALVSVAYAAVAIYPPEPKPAEFEDEEGCYIDDLKQVLPYDDPFYPDDACEVYTCQKSNNQTIRESCGAVYVKPGCTKSADDLTKDYPACCGTEVCPSTTQAPTTQVPTTQAPTTQVPTTQAPTTQAPTTQVPTTQPPESNQRSYAYASAQSISGQVPDTAQALPLVPTTQATTTQAPTTQAPSTQAPTTQAPPNNQGSFAYASAKSVSGQAPVIKTYTSGPNAQASAFAL